jgi:hypothetical protein
MTNETIYWIYDGLNIGLLVCIKTWKITMHWYWSRWKHEEENYQDYCYCEETASQGAKVERDMVICKIEWSRYDGKLIYDEILENKMRMSQAIYSLCPIIQCTLKNLRQLKGILKWCRFPWIKPIMEFLLKLWFTFKKNFAKSKHRNHIECIILVKL